MADLTDLLQKMKKSLGNTEVVPIHLKRYFTNQNAIVVKK